jgi:hypothetical protein
MGLNAIVTRNISSLIKSLTLKGEWKEHDIEEHGKVGRVPDNSMMLNIAVRAAADRTTALESFTWDLNTKMLLPVYTGLAARSTLKSLTIRFPSTRHPRPIITVPPFPNLESLKVTHIDPICYPDDISNCLFHSPKLHTLKMHFSPRMRAQSEPSVNLHYFFRKAAAAPNFKLRIRTIAYQNLFSLPNNDEIDEAFDHEALENVTILNSTGDEEGGGPITFIDASWDHKPPAGIIRLKSIRTDHVSQKQIGFLNQLCGLEKVYFVSAPPEPYPPRPAAMSNGTSNHTTPITPSTSHSPNTPTSIHLSSNKYALRNDFLDALFRNHGTTLQHLLLPSRWLLTPDIVSRLVRSCPNLTQLGFALDFQALESVRLLLSFLPKLRAIRILRNKDLMFGMQMCLGTGSNNSGSDSTSLVNMSRNTTSSQPETCSENEKGEEKAKPADMAAAGIEFERDEKHIEIMGRLLALNRGEEYPKLKYIGIGQKVFQLGGLELVETPDPVEGEVEKVWRRRAWRIPEEKVMHVEIWGMDSNQI